MLKNDKKRLSKMKLPSIKSQKKLIKSTDKIIYIKILEII